MTPGAAGGANGWGIKNYKEEEVFASETVHHLGQIIGLVVCETRAQAEAAAKLVKVSYEELPPLLTIDECVEAGSFIAPVCGHWSGHASLPFVSLVASGVRLTSAAV